MTRITCSQLRGKKPDELEKLREEFISLQISKKNVDENLRKSIARVHIVQNQTIKANLREFYRGEKHQPKDLREKKTRAIRRQLTSEEKSIELKKIQRRKNAFPQRNFALKE